MTIPNGPPVNVAGDGSRVGVSGNPRAAREPIWTTMMRSPVNSEVLFHWLIAMLSGRTVRQIVGPDEL